VYPEISDFALLHVAELMAAFAVAMTMALGYFMTMRA